MTAARKLDPRVTEEEYLAAERAAEERHEYIDGRVRAMAGESLSHGRVTVNLTALFQTQLRGKPCEPFTKDTKVRSGPAGPWPAQRTRGLFSYPDLVVVCGEPEYLDDKDDVITNPRAVVEVLSPSTEAFDRGDKFERLRLWNPTLTDYLLVSQSRPVVEQYTRQPDGTWRFREFRGPDAVCVIDGLGVRLPLAEVYERVTFPDPDAGG